MLPVRRKNSGRLALILIYVGGGKGKTSACVGQAARALGAGLSVAFAQFMKRDGVAGEQKILKRLLGDDFKALGAGFFRDENQRETQRQKALELVQWAAERPRDMIILDESLRALERGLIFKEELDCFLSRRGSETEHVALSGARVPDWILDLADMVTETRDLKHYFRNGVGALPGLEY